MINSTPVRPVRWAYLAAALLLVFGLLEAAAYLLTPYETLRDWYLGLNGCFYNAETWTTKFFTPLTKAQGNRWAGLTAAGCLAGLALLLYRWHVAPTDEARPAAPAVEPRLPRLDRLDAVLLAGLGAVAGGLWWWAERQLVPGTDEIFSALYCAQGPAVQTVGYYMLPNNHILFNLLNGLLFGGWADNLVTTGRLLSGLCYLTTLAGIYYWLRRQVAHRWLPPLLTLVAALQFPLWAFGTQARGYALYGLAHWGAFIGLTEYLRTRRGGWLLLNAVSCAAGYATVPSFLYFHLAQLLFGLVYQLLVPRRPDWRFWRYQAAALLTVLVFYLPTLGFSGVAALASNEYVRPKSHTLAGYLPDFGADLRAFMDYTFSRAKLLGLMLSYVLVPLPLLLLRARRQSPWFALGLFYLLLLVVLLGLMLLMHRSPNQRNLIGHCSLVLVLSPLTLYWLLGRLPARRHPLRWQLGAVAVLLLVLTLKLVKANPVDKAEEIYLFDNQTSYHGLEARIAQLPAGSRVRCTYESFCATHAARQRGLTALMPCEAAADHQPADYYIVHSKETLPPAVAGQYELLYRAPFDRIYRRRN